MKIYFYIVISLLLICSCKKESGIVKNTTLFSKEDFKQTISLKGKIIEIDSLWKPIRIWVQKNREYSARNRTGRISELLVIAVLP